MKQNLNLKNAETRLELYKEARENGMLDKQAFRDLKAAETAISRELEEVRRILKTQLILYLKVGEITEEEYKTELAYLEK
jgi:hypothetical protein